MSDEIPGPQRFHLWIDFETTGLAPWHDAVLEIGWTITDTDLRMLTPLRSRLAVLNPSVSYTPMGTLVQPRNFDPDPAEEFWRSLGDVVQDMHRQSGLMDDLIGAWTDSTGRMSVVEHPRDFERLLLEDMVAAGFDMTRQDKLVISGAGVSHFDVHVLAAHWPDLFPLLPRPQDVPAYWQHDTSVAWRVLGETAQKVVNDLAPKLRDLAPGTPEWSPFWSLFTAEAPADHTVSHLVRVREDGWAVLARDAVRPHRAADDVVASLLDARLLRSLPAILNPVT